MWHLLRDRPLIRIAALAAIPVLLLAAGMAYLLRLSSDSAAPISGVPALPAISLEPNRAGSNESESAGRPGTDPEPGTGRSTGSGTDSTSRSPARPPATTAGTTTAGTTRVPSETHSTATRRPSSAASSPASPRPPLPKHATISVGGVRLDGSIPSSNICVTFTNTEFDQPVRAVGAVVTDGPGYIVVDDSNCRDHKLLQHPFRSCRDAVLEPGGPGCDTGVAVGPGGRPAPDGPGSTQVNGTIRLQLRATCTSRTGKPCSALDDTHAPSPAAPIEVSWTDEGRVRTVTVKTDETPPVTESSSLDSYITGGIDPGRTRSLLVDEEPPSPSPHGG